jgi:hypothetical protein
MKKIVLLASGCFLWGALLAQADPQPRITKTAGQGRLIKVSDRVSGLAENAEMNKIIVRDENGVRWADGRRPISPLPAADAEPIKGTGPELQTKKDGLVNMKAATLSTNVNGMGYTFVNPPDPTVAAGPNHVIQMINGSSGALFQIFSKSGTALNSPTYLDNLTGRGGLGDPIVLYDHLADRFVMTEFANKSETGTEGLIMAVSQNADPLGSWYVYYFSTGTTFPDYPKFSVWPDGYYATTNDFANAQSYNGSTIYAFDRSRMIAGLATTTFQSVKFSTTSYSKYFAMSPVLLQGTNLPPAGTGGLIAYMVDEFWSSSTADRDSIGLIEFDVNWANPSASVLTNISSIRTTDFKSQICTATRGQCIPQPGTTSRLEALHMRVMNQPIYRNFGTEGGIVLSFSEDVGSGRSGIRWYELRKSGTNSWGIYQQSTWSLADAVHRWMPSIAYDGAGNIGLIYNVSASSSVFPGVRFTGRLAGDPINTMTVAETVIINGSSRNGSTRYGDYNHLVADPSGGSFWMTAQWNSSTQWSTRIASFNISGTVTPCDAPTGLGSSNITASGATVSWAAVSGASSYTVEYKEQSAGTWTTAASATTSTSVNLDGLLGNTLYDWRVRTNCSGNQSSFSAAQFTTLAPPPCDAPTGLNSSNITSSSATVSWTAVSGAVSYTVDYKRQVDANWTTAASATTSTSVNLGSLSASTLYDWRVRTNCSGNQSSFSEAQFTTLVSSSCTDAYEPNDVSTSAASIQPGSAINAFICTSTDRDWYTFTNTNQTRYVRVTLNFPAGVNYNMRLIRPNGQVAGTTSGSSSPKALNYNGNPTGAYRIEVYSSSGFSTTNAYTLLAEISGSSFAPSVTLREEEGITAPALQAYPNPAKGMLQIAYLASSSGKANLKLVDMKGRVAGSRIIGVSKGTNNVSWDISRLPEGIYLLQAIQGNEKRTAKVAIVQ